VTQTVEKRLQKQGIAVGDVARVASPGFTGEGRVMPRHAFSAPDCLILKLQSGYNVGIRLDADTTVTKVSGPAKAPAATAAVPKAAQGLPRVAVLGTGGTIASFVDYRTGAVHPAATAEELAFATPEIFQQADVHAEVVFQVFSEDLSPKDWRTLAAKVADAFAAGARGVVIPHGTDTLGYTAAALAFMLQDLPGPVVLVGAQRSSDRPSSDAAENLTAACRVAAAGDVGEVVVAMHAGPSDDRVAIHRGVRVRKNHTSRRDAFESVNGPPLGFVADGTITLSGPHRAPSQGGPRLVEGWEDDVGILWSYPGLDGKTVAHHAGRGLVLAGTGLGHVPRRCLDAVEKATKAGTLVVMASQCLWGRTNLRVYSTGRDLLSRGVVEAGDMLPEVAFVKLQHALGVARDRDEAIRIMTTDVAGELAPSTRLENGGDAA
jgi:glutamyl-tRNA(Gln) amidotransferase subunit D